MRIPPGELAFARAKDFDNPMEIVKVEPLAGGLTPFPRAEAGEYNIDGFDMGSAFDRGGEEGSRTPHYLLNHRRGIAGRYETPLRMFRFA